MQIRAIALACAAFFASVATSAANLVTVTYTGTATGVYLSDFTDPNPGLRVFISTPAVGTYIFDTDMGVSSWLVDGSYSLVGGNISASLTFNELTINGGNMWNAHSKYILTAGADGVPFVIPNLNDRDGGSHFDPGGGFQFGLCPTRLAPCGTFAMSSITTIGTLPAQPVPGPIVGAGIPSLIFGAAMILAARRRHYGGITTP